MTDQDPNRYREALKEIDRAAAAWSDDEEFGIDTDEEYRFDCDGAFLEYVGKLAKEALRLMPAQSTVPDPDDHHLRPRRTHLSTKVWRLVGGTEDNDLWTQVETDDDGIDIIRSTWVPSDEQRQRIADGENIELIAWGVQPPVAVMLTSVPLGKAPNVER